MLRADPKHRRGLPASHTLMASLGAASTWAEVLCISLKLEEDGNPLQCWRIQLENPKDGGAW